MKKYYISVWISVYANSAEEANAEVRNCLNTGKGYIHDYEVSDVVDKRCDCEGYQTCPRCR